MGLGRRRRRCRPQARPGPPAPPATPVQCPLFFTTRQFGSAQRSGGIRYGRELMFTGIVAEQGTVLSIEHDGGSSATLRVEAPGTSEGLPLGGSIAVNGVCLTATAIEGREFSVDVMGETLVRTTIG